MAQFTRAVDDIFPTSSRRSLPIFAILRFNYENITAMQHLS